MWYVIAILVSIAVLIPTILYVALKHRNVQVELDKVGRDEDQGEGQRKPDEHVEVPEENQRHARVLSGRHEGTH